MLDRLDRQIINELQGGFPLSERPYAEAAARLGLEEQDLIDRIGRLLDQGRLSRFGPMYNAEKMGGAFCLCAVKVPQQDVERIAACINSYAEVAHNYERQHRFNIWFVLASDTTERIEQVIRDIEAEIALTVFAFPKLEEFFIGLRVDA